MEEAYGYNLTTGEGSTRGMRGYIIYNPDNGNNVFFPIGKSGYGRWKKEKTVTDQVEKAGTLRYANRSVYYRTDILESNGLEQIGYRPLFWNLFKSEGAIYWLQYDSEHGQTAWDMNYKTLDFSSFDTNAYGLSDSDSDACFIRCVLHK